jgi:hypothetical protein
MDCPICETNNIEACPMIPGGFDLRKNIWKAYCSKCEKWGPKVDCGDSSYEWCLGECITAWMKELKDGE